MTGSARAATAGEIARQANATLEGLHMPALQLVQTSIPVDQRTTTYTDADWNQATSGWRLTTHCAAAAVFAMELPSESLGEEEFRPKPQLVRPSSGEQVLLHEAFSALAQHTPVPDTPTVADVGKRRGRFVR